MNKNSPMKKKMLAAGLLLALCALTAAASTGTEFQASGDKFDGWLGGQYGRAAALASTGVGVIWSLFTKSFMPVLGGLGLAVVLPLIIGIINGSFTAVMPAVL